MLHKMILDDTDNFFAILYFMMSPRYRGYQMSEGLILNLLNELNKSTLWSIWRA